jgi:hypothetical protein
MPSHVRRSKTGTLSLRTGGGGDALQDLASKNDAAAKREDVGTLRSRMRSASGGRVQRLGRANRSRRPDDAAARARWRRFAGRFGSRRHTRQGIPINHKKLRPFSEERLHVPRRASASVRLAKGRRWHCRKGHLHRSQPVDTRDAAFRPGFRGPS